MLPIVQLGIWMQYKRPIRPNEPLNTLLDHYAQVIIWQCAIIQEISTYLTVDAYFAKANFIDRICSHTSLHIVSLLRQDARLRYRYCGPKTSGRGRPRHYAGKVDVTQPDFDYFTLSHQDEELRIYSAVVNCPFLKRDIKLAYTQYLDAQGLPTHYKLYVSTYQSLSAWMLVMVFPISWTARLRSIDLNRCLRA